MRNSFPQKLAAAMLAVVASAASMWKDPQVRLYAGDRAPSAGGGNKRAKSSFKQNKRRGL